MIAWVFVEGPSDVAMLKELWAPWRVKLKSAGHGLRVVHLNSKAQFFHRIGPRAAQNLVDKENIVVGLPDLYPVEPFQTTYPHSNLAELRRVQTALVEKALIERFDFDTSSSKQVVADRFCGAALKHDAEMLLLAAHDELRLYLKTKDKLRNWTRPVEDQNQAKPPKRVVEELFSRYRRHSYRDTVDAPAVLRKVHDLRAMMQDTEIGKPACPEFKRVIDWIATKTGVGY